MGTRYRSKSFLQTYGIDAPVVALSWLGRQGTRAVAALVVIGIAVPPIGALLKPFVSEAIFALLCVAFLRVDPAAFRGCLKRSVLVLAATAWTTTAIPAVFGASYLALGLKDRSPDLCLALILQAVASPMMAAPALAALMGLDSTLVLVALITSTAVIPFSAPAFTYAFIGDGLTLSPLALGVRLFAILAGSALVGITVRRMAGPVAIERHADEINGVNILVLFVFVAAVMESVAARFLAAPVLTVGFAALAFLVYFAVFGLTSLLFVRAGPERAFVLGLMASQRNMGLMLAATGGALPDLTWLYFALSQFPIYLSPQLLRPLARRLVSPSRIAPRPRGPLDSGGERRGGSASSSDVP
jgi:BASS family bile acid:Na+ symporter